jgi:hypothetical protein
MDARLFAVTETISFAATLKLRRLLRERHLLISRFRKDLGPISLDRMVKI